MWFRDGRHTLLFFDMYLLSAERGVEVGRNTEYTAGQDWG